MYQVGKFLTKNPKINPVPVVWVFKKKGQMKCYWPILNLQKKMLKKTPPPMVESRYWDVLDVEILLNGKMFEKYEAAEAAARNIMDALRESETDNSSTSTLSSTSTRKSTSDHSVVSSIGDASLTANNEAAVAQILTSDDHSVTAENASIGKLEVGKATANILATVSEKESNSTSTSSRSSTGDHSIVTENSLNANIGPSPPDCLAPTKLLATANTSSAAKVTLTTETSIATNMKSVLKLKIRSVKQYEEYESWLFNEDNMELYAQEWIQKPKSTNEVDFMKMMAQDIFEQQFFIENVSFVAEEGKISLAESNLLRCWIYIIGRKFGEKIILEKIIQSMDGIIGGSLKPNTVKPICEKKLFDKATSTAEEVANVSLGEHFSTAAFFPIDDDLPYLSVEKLLLKEENIKIVSDDWSRICQNKPKLFIQLMINETFTENFLLNHTTLKKGEKMGETKRHFLDGSNIFKCWEATVKKKFPNENIQESDIKKQFRTMRNTLNK